MFEVTEFWGRETLTNWSLHIIMVLGIFSFAKCLRLSLYETDRMVLSMNIGG